MNSRQKETARVSTSTKLPGTSKVTPSRVTSLVDKRASIEESLTRIVDSMDKQSEQMSIRMSELERTVQAERENLRDEIKQQQTES